MQRRYIPEQKILDKITELESKKAGLAESRGGLKLNDYHDLIQEMKKTSIEINVLNELLRGEI